MFDLVKKIDLKYFYFFSLSIFTLIVYSSIRPGADQLIQFGSALNFIDHGSFEYTYINENGEIIRNWVYDWPVFYRIYILPILLISGKNIEVTCIISMILSYFIFVLSLGFLLKRSNINQNNTVLKILLVAFPLSFVPIRYFSDIDLIALSFLFFAIGSVLEYTFYSNKIFYLILSVVLTGFLPVVRYAYAVNCIVLTIIIIYVLLFIRKKSMRYVVLLTIPVSSIMSLLWNPYFVNKSNAYTTEIHSVVQNETIYFWLKPFYAPIFNAFYPDYIIMSLLKKFPSLYEKFAVSTLTSFMIISLIIFVFIINLFIKQLKSLKNIFNPENRFSITMLIVLLSNLLFYVILYRNEYYTYNEIHNDIFMYKSLGVVSRYFGPIYLTFILFSISVYFLSRNKILKYLFLSSFVLGFLHFLYLRTVYHPFNREENMNIVNNPKGSYKDLMNINNIILEEKQPVYFVDSISESNDNIRQLGPRNIARASGCLELKTTNVKKLKNLGIKKYILAKRNSEFNDLEKGIIYIGTHYSLKETYVK